jgi:hypothetical protein
MKAITDSGKALLVVGSLLAAGLVQAAVTGVRAGSLEGVSDDSYVIHASIELKDHLWHAAYNERIFNDKDICEAFLKVDGDGNDNWLRAKLWLLRAAAMQNSSVKFDCVSVKEARVLTAKKTGA